MHTHHRAFSRLTATLLVGTCFAVSLAAADLVSRIQVISLSGEANQAALEQVVFSTIGTKVGQELSLPQLSKDVTALIKTPGIQNAQTRVDTLEDGTRQVVFLIALRQRLQEIAFRGRNVIAEKKLRVLVKSKIGEPLSERQIAADRKAIIDKYEKVGYRGTAVTHEIEPLGDGDGARLTFVIVEQPRHKLKGVAFEGNTVFTDAELQDAILTKRAWWRYIFRVGNWYNEQLQAADKSRIASLYGTKGYLDAQVTRVELKAEENPLWVTPVYYISEGTCYHLRNVTIAGNEKFSSEDLLGRRLLTTGMPYDTAMAEHDLDAMKAPYQNLGYLDLDFRATLSKDTENGAVDLFYQITEGSPSRINQILISGNTYTADRVIRRELTILEDDLADARKIRQSKNRLENLGYFSNVEILPKTTENPDRRDLSVQVEEKPTGSISVGAAFSTEDSVMGFLELSETNFSLQKLLKLEKPKGDGQRMRAYVGVGTDTSAVNISLTEPSIFDSPFELTNEFFLNTRFEDDYDERHIGYGVTLAWPVAFQLPFIPEHTEYWRLAMGLRLEHIRISNLDDEEKFNPEDGTTWPDNAWKYPEGRLYALKADEGGEFTNRIILSLSRDTRNHFIFPNRGSRLDMDLEYVTRALGSYADYIKFHAGAELYLPVFEDIFLRLAANADTVEHISGDDVKVFDRYFAGGFGTIRGFKRHYVSPVNGNENSIGGSTMLVGTAEFIKPIKNFMFFKVFCDVGNVWWDSFDADLGDLNASIGVGIQFRALPIRLDYGYPIVTQNKHLDGSSGRFHFSITTSF